MNINQIAGKYTSPMDPSWDKSKKNRFFDVIWFPLFQLEKWNNKHLFSWARGFKKTCVIHPCLIGSPHVPSFLLKVHEQETSQKVWWKPSGSGIIWNSNGSTNPKMLWIPKCVLPSGIFGPHFIISFGKLEIHWRAMRQPLASAWRLSFMAAKQGTTTTVLTARISLISHGQEPKVRNFFQLSEVQKAKLLIWANEKLSMAAIKKDKQISHWLGVEYWPNCIKMVISILESLLSPWFIWPILAVQADDGTSFPSYNIDLWCWWTMDTYNEKIPSINGCFWFP